MSEIIGYTVCTHKNCNLAVEVKQDKRKKYFLNCRVHGRNNYSTNESQHEIAKLIAHGHVVDSAENINLAPRLNESTSEKNSESLDKSPDNPEKKGTKGGKIAVAIFSVILITIGVKSWNTK